MSTTPLKWEGDSSNVSMRKPRGVWEVVSAALRRRECTRSVSGCLMMPTWRESSVAMHKVSHNSFSASIWRPRSASAFSPSSNSRNLPLLLRNRLPPVERGGQSHLARRMALITCVQVGGCLCVGWYR